jgi:hypothetical protein
VPDLPAIVFVSRRPPPQGAAAGVPGLGPQGRTAAAGGRLLVRRPDGKVRALVPPGHLFDVGDPAVSYDGARVAFAAKAHRDSGWRIWVVGGDGRGLAAVTRTVAGGGLRPGGWDDIDPCWLPDGRLCFASTRWPVDAESGRPATNLFVVDPKGGGPRRITHEHHGAEEPSVDPATGRIVFARRWSSRYLASDLEASGITTDPARALPLERMDLWQAVSVTPDGNEMRLAGGNARRRSELVAYQPLLLSDGTLVGVTAEPPSLDSAGSPAVVAFPRGFAEAVRLTRPPAAMCSPAPLPGGGLLVACDPRGDGGWGIHRIGLAGGEPEPVVDRRGWLDLDPAVLAPRPLPPVLGELLGALPREEPPRTVEDLADLRVAMRFDCLNVFANAPVDWPVPDAPPMARDVRIRFFAALSRPGAAGGDSVVLLREGVVTRSGAVHEDVTPGDVPMFEQLVGADGRVLTSSSGPAHVPGFNVGRTGSGTHCVGCHVGHSAIPVPVSYGLGKRFNGATSAAVTATSEAAGSRAAAVVDRRTRGDVREVAWIAAPGSSEWVRLQWPFPLAVDSLVVYGVRPDAARGTDLRVAACEVALYRNGRLVSRFDRPGPIDPGGTGVDCAGVLADRVEVRPAGARGRVLGVPATGLAEIEAKVRIPED